MFGTRPGSMMIPVILNFLVIPSAVILTAAVLSASRLPTVLSCRIASLLQYPSCFEALHLSIEIREKVRFCCRNSTLSFPSPLKRGRLVNISLELLQETVIGVNSCTFGPVQPHTHVLCHIPGMSVFPNQHAFRILRVNAAPHPPDFSRLIFRLCCCKLFTQY